MGKIIKFKDKTIEDKFMETLSEEQLDLFYKIIVKAKDDYERLEADYFKKVAECAVLKIELEALKNGLNT